MLLFGLLISVPIRSSAAESSVLTFDLTNKSAQEQTITLSDGSLCTVGIEPVSNLTKWDHAIGNGYESWKVYWMTGYLNSGYIIDINNTNITRAYDAYYTGIGVSVHNESLNYSSKWALYRIEFTFGIAEVQPISGTRFLRANIYGNTLSTTIDGF